MFKTIWFEVIWRNLSKHSGKEKQNIMDEQNKKSTLRAFASRANKPFAGKFAKDWKKITENSLIREKSSITGPKSALKISDSTYLQMKI